MYEEDGKLQALLSRIKNKDLLTKWAESLPQMLLQGYVVFVVGQYGQVAIASLAISLGDLALASIQGLPKLIPSNTVQKWKTQSMCGKIIGFLWLSTDLASRALAYAMVWSEVPRVVGLPIAISLCCCGTCCAVGRSERGKETLSMRTSGEWRKLLTWLVVHFVPAYALLEEEDSCGDSCLLMFRWMEVAGYAAIAWYFARGPCGESVVWETELLCSMLGANLFFLTVLRCCRFATGDDVERYVASNDSRDAPDA